MSTTSSKPTPRKDQDRWPLAGAMILAVGVGLLMAFVLASVVAGVSISPIIWYLARSLGMTTYILLWVSVITGLGLTTSLLGFVGDKGIVLQLHRLATDLSLAGVAMHVLAIALDPTVEMGMLGVLVPMTSSIRQPWTDLGILSAYGLIGIALSFAVRRWIGSDRWRSLHYLTFGFWAMALIHAIGAGTDTGTIWAAAVYILSVSSVTFLLTYRILQGRVAPNRSRESPPAARLHPAESAS